MNPTQPKNESNHCVWKQKKVDLTQTLNCSVYTKLGFGSHNVHGIREPRGIAEGSRGTGRSEPFAKLLSHRRYRDTNHPSTRFEGRRRRRIDNWKTVLCLFALERKKGRKEERELSAVAMALAVPQIMSCCGSTRFATEMALVGPFSSLQSAIDSARDIWWNKVWLCRLFIPPPLLCGFTHSWKTITESEVGSLQWWWLFFQRDPILFYFSLWICGRSDAIFFPPLCQFVAFISQGNVTEKLGLEKDFSKLRKFCCEIWSEKEPSNGFRGCCEPAIKCKQMVVSDDDGEMILCVRFFITNKKIVGNCARQCACLCVFTVQ